MRLFVLRSTRLILILGTLLSAPLLFADDSCAPLLASPSPFIRPTLAVSETGKISMTLSPRKSLPAKVTNLVVEAPLRPLFQVKKLEQVMHDLQKSLRSPDAQETPYFQKLIEAFRIQPRFRDTDLTLIPASGPLLVTLNHPLSGLELLAVASAVQKVRSDVKIVSSTFLGLTPGLKDHAIFFDPSGGADAQAHNLAARAQILESLRQGQALIISPAGAVSVKAKLSDQHTSDPIWKLGVAEFLNQVPETRVLPVFVEGQVSEAFHWAQRIHPFAGTAMILREFSNLIGQPIAFRMGKSVDPKTLQSFTSKRQQMNYLRARTYMLAPGGKTATNERQREEEIAEPIAQDVIEGELASQAVVYDLAPDEPERLMKTFIARGSDIPQTVKEIGRLREITFWKAHEGTGLARDNDDYDADYLHLIAWDKKQKRIAGAYRVGLTRELLQKRGLAGLYTSNQFDLRAIAEKYLIDKVEVGRSFILPEYQGKPFSLMVLFRGLARFIGSHPEYNGFFGAVSISNDYQEASKLLITRWALRHAPSNLIGQVPVQNPPQFHSRLSDAEIDLLLEKAPTFQDLNALVSSIEGNPSAKAPQLISIYRDFGARFIAFDVDPSFNTTDGLILTDIRQVPQSEHVDYMGDEIAKTFKTRWGLD